MFLFWGNPILVLGIYNHKVGHPKKGTWYEPTGRTIILAILGAPRADVFTWRYLERIMSLLGGI